MLLWFFGSISTDSDLYILLRRRIIFRPVSDFIYLWSYISISIVACHFTIRMYDRHNHIMFVFLLCVWYKVYFHFLKNKKYCSLLVSSKLWQQIFFLWPCLSWNLCYTFLTLIQVMSSTSSSSNSSTIKDILDVTGLSSMTVSAPV